MALGRQRLLLLAAAVIILQSCQQPNKEAAGTASDSAGNSQAAPASRIPRSEDGLVRFSVGSTKFMAPDDVVGFQVTYQGQSIDFVTLGVSLQDFVGHSETEAAHQTDHVFISLERRAELPISLPETREEAEAEFDRIFPDRLFAMSVNEALGLLEINYKDTRDYVAYRRTDDYMRPNDGLIPTAICLMPSSPTLCDGHGFIKPDIAIEYRFDPARLPQWPTIDEAVFNYIEDIRQLKDVVEE